MEEKSKALFRAKFSDGPDLFLGNGTRAYVKYVDSRNSCGAVIRGDYTCGISGSILNDAPIFTAIFQSPSPHPMHSLQEQFPHPERRERLVACNGHFF